MAALLRHPRDHVRTCVCCGAHCEHRYNGAQVLDTEDGAVVEYTLTTCTACGSTAAVDPVPASADRMGEVTDRREWEWLRRAVERVVEVMA